VVEYFKHWWTRKEGKAVANWTLEQQQSARKKENPIIGERRGKTK
jgi:hypothetical protein